MRILSNVAVSGNLNLGSSNKKDTFVIGTPDLNNDNVNTDVFTVWANADFKNNVQLGANADDIITVSGTMSASIVNINSLTSSFISSSTFVLDDFSFLSNTLQVGYLEVLTEISSSGNITGSYFKGDGSYIKRPYGVFCSTETQSGSANIAYPITLNVTEESDRVSIVSGSQIKVEVPGVYNIAFSAQLYKSSGATVDTTSIWFRKNGSNIPRSNTETAMDRSSDKQVAAWNFMTSLNAGDYIEIVWSSDQDVNQLLFQDTKVNPTRPSTPSVIVTVNQV